MRSSWAKICEQSLTPAHNRPRQGYFQEQQQKLDVSCNGPFQELVDSATGTMNKISSGRCHNFCKNLPKPSVAV
jgi:hypothetical protein